MTYLITTIGLALLGLAGWRWGADSRDGRDWQPGRRPDGAAPSRDGGTFPRGGSGGGRVTGSGPRPTRFERAVWAGFGPAPAGRTVTRTRARGQARPQPATVCSPTSSPR